jgi:hypothetical protein
MRIIQLDKKRVTQKNRIQEISMNEKMHSMIRRVHFYCAPGKLKF